MTDQQNQPAEAAMPDAGAAEHHWQPVPGQPGVTEGTHPCPPSIESMVGALKQPTEPEPQDNAALIAEAERLLAEYHRVNIIENDPYVIIAVEGRGFRHMVKLATALRQAETRIRELESGLTLNQ